MPELAPPATLLVAPGGYAKSYWLNRLRQDLAGPVLEASFSPAFSDTLFDLLAENCRLLGLGEPDPAQPQKWAGSIPALNVVIDNWHLVEPVERVQSFWHSLLEDPPAGWQFLIASRKPPRLPLASLVAAGGRIYGREQLAWDLAEAKSHWQQAGLEWQAEDADMLASSQGWPLVMLLHLRRRKGELDETHFQLLLNLALQGWLPEFATMQNLWQAEIAARLRDWQADSPNWPPLLQDLIGKQARSQPAYWLQRVTQQDLPPDQARVLLERSLSLCRPYQRALRLSVLTRLAHVASQQGDWKLIDKCLAQGLELLEDGQSVDVAAWHYLSANRARQCCRYAEAHSAVDALLALPALHSAVMNFQVRARILRGLTAYQQGDYEATRRTYNEALFLAETDGNTQMQLELKLMLAFLDALLGQTEEPLPASIQAEVEALPLSAQPLVWLNLAFLQILGEHLDLKQGQHILEKVRQSAAKLCWSSLEPMIADVEARLWRFHQDYDRAERLHRQALAGLESQTFDWLYATLNHALTLMRRKAHAEARPLLEAVVARARETGTKGLLREAQAALQSIDPHQAEQTLPVRSEAPLTLVRGDQPLLEIQTFGSFQLRLDGKAIERWPRKRARHLLLQLLLHPHGLHRETLADWLTGADDLEQALRGLDVHIHALRKLLEPERKGKQASRYIRFHDAVYSFNWDCHYRWDAESFTRQHQLWLKCRESDLSAAEQAAEAALQLYTGPFLPELDFADEWLGERESYARKAGDLVLWSLEHLSSRGAFEQAEERAELLLRWDGISEQGFAWLLRLAGQLRDRSRIERLGERMESTFEKELGCPPPKELLQLYHSQIQLMA